MIIIVNGFGHQPMWLQYLNRRFVSSTDCGDVNFGCVFSNDCCSNLECDALTQRCYDPASGIKKLDKKFINLLI